ncbi:MAG TPA: NifU N-terminal domain-containing protein [Phycisphaerales bacterium]|nr:NifU N-terminal domain-containing protein [Phycisphaerales bacterium]
MGYDVVEFQDTPNPNALKCVLDRPPPAGGSGIRSYQTAEAAAGDPLGAAMMGVPGVVGVLIGAGWVTVSKAPAAEWKAIKAGVKKVMSGAE